MILRLPKGETVIPTGFHGTEDPRIVWVIVPKNDSYHYRWPEGTEVLHPTGWPKALRGELGSNG